MLVVDVVSVDWYMIRKLQKISSIIIYTLNASFTLAINIMRNNQLQMFIISGFKQSMRKWEFQLKELFSYLLNISQQHQFYILPRTNQVTHECKKCPKLNSQIAMLNIYADSLLYCCSLEPQNVQPKGLFSFELSYWKKKKPQTLRRKSPNDIFCFIFALFNFSNAFP